MLNQVTDLLDPVSVEMLFFEADHLIDTQREGCAVRYRSQFQNPALFDAFVYEYRIRIRSRIKTEIDKAKTVFTSLGYDMTMKDPLEEGDENGC